MSQDHADRNLLFGILALQMDFITRDQLVAAMQAWVFDKSQNLGQILIRQKVLEADTNALLDALVKKHLAQHGESAEKSLAALGSTDAVRDDLNGLTDANVQASLGHVGASMQLPVDPYATRASGATAASASGGFSAPSTTAGDASVSGLRFRIVRPHARGGLGEVHVARDAELNRDVALKQIQARHAHDKESQARFMLEAEITGGLEHPGIVPVYGLGQYSDGRPFYAMRFIRGDSLKEAIEAFYAADKPGRDSGERSLAMRELLERLIDVCNAISYAHSRSVLHRDLKPGNIMLGKYGETLVVDWGLAKPMLAAGKAPPPTAATMPGEGSLMPSSGSLASHTLMGSAMGTPQYMSPEQAAGRLDLLGPASDVYSLGATLYAILTGVAPVQDTDVNVVLKKVERGQIPPPSSIKKDVPKPLDAVCRKAMALAPADRYATPMALAEDIKHWLADEPVSAWPEPWTVKAWRWIKNNRTKVTATAAGVMVAFVLSIVAGVFLNAAWNREYAAKEREAIAKTKAVENYQLARQSVDRYHTEVSEDVLLHEPGMQVLRKQLLVAARDFYADFVKGEHGQDADTQAGLGRAYYRLAQITGDIGSETEAIKLHLKGQKLFTELAASAPSAEAQSDLGNSWYNLGRLYRRTEQLEKAETAYKNAIDIWQELVTADRKEEYVAELARSQLGLGNVLQFDRLDQARKIYEEALKTREVLTRANPKPAYKRDLAVSYSNLAIVLSALSQKDPEAKEAYLKAIATQADLAGTFPYISQYQNDVARSHYLLADLYASLPDNDKKNQGLARTEYRSAERIWSELSQKHPAVTDFHESLMRVWPRLSLEECIDAVEAKKKLAETYKDNPRYQGELARAYYYLGGFYHENSKWQPAEQNYLRAAEILTELAVDKSAIPQFKADLARVDTDLGYLYQVQTEDKHQLAEVKYSAAIKLWQELARKYPKELDYSQNLAITLYNLANLRRKNGDPDAAKEYYTQAIGAWDTVGQILPAERLMRAVALARSAKLDLAAAEAVEVEPYAKSGSAYYQLAAIHALVASDEKLAVDQHIAASVKLLKKAQEKKYFKQAANSSRFDSDADFNAIRDRPAFREFRDELDKKK